MDLFALWKRPLWKVKKRKEIFLESPWCKLILSTLNEQNINFFAKFIETVVQYFAKKLIMSNIRSSGVKIIKYW